MAVDRVPLAAPLYGATFGEAVGRFFRKYAVFTGRSSRSEFWWAQLFLAIVYSAVTLVLVAGWIAIVVAAILPLASTDRPSPAVISAVVVPTVLIYAALFAIQLPLIVPTVASTVRRLHDAGFTGLYALLLLVPGGAYAVLALCILASNPSGARFDAPQPGYGTEPVPSSTIRA